MTTVYLLVIPLSSVIQKWCPRSWRLKEYLPAYVAAAGSGKLQSCCDSVIDRTYIGLQVDSRCALVGRCLDTFERRMPSSCAVCGRTLPSSCAVCGSISKSMGKKLSFYWFPRDRKTRDLWRTSLNIPSNFVIEDHHIVCSQDFLYGDKMDGSPTPQGCPRKLWFGRSTHSARARQCSHTKHELGILRSKGISHRPTSA